MTKRTTIEIDQDLLYRAKQALGESTTRATVEEALRRAANSAETDHERRAAKQRRMQQAARPSLKDLLLAESPRANIPVPPRRGWRRRVPATR